MGNTSIQDHLSVISVHSLGLKECFHCAGRGSAQMGLLPAPPVTYTAWHFCLKDDTMLAAQVPKSWAGSTCHSLYCHFTLLPQKVLSFCRQKVDSITGKWDSCWRHVFLLKYYGKDCTFSCKQVSSPNDFKIKVSTKVVLGNYCREKEQKGKKWHTWMKDSFWGL